MGKHLKYLSAAPSFSIHVREELLKEEWRRGEEL
jgi:hypothetical protein